jgi:hypothetical protein
MRFSTSLFPFALAALIAGCSTPGVPGGGDDDSIGDDDHGSGDDDDDDDGGGDDDGSGDDDGDVDADIDETPGEIPDAAAEAPDATPPLPDAGPHTPETLTVCATGATFTTIGAAIAAAGNGDTIEVCAGTYAERLEIVNKALTLRATAGAASTTIDAGAGGTAIAVVLSPGGVRIDGFTITRGAAAVQGGGIRCVDSKLDVVASVVRDSTAPDSGAGLFAERCVVDIGGTTFTQNAAGKVGGGVLFVEATGTVHDSQLVANSAQLRGGGAYSNSDVTFTNNAFTDNTAGWTGGGLHIVKHAPLIEGNTFLRNSAPNDGGGIYLDQGSATLRNNNIGLNVSGDDGGGVRSFEATCTLDGNTIEGNRAEDSGGGVRISHVPCTIIDNLVRNNVAGGTGGGYDLDNDASTMRGGEITGNQAGGSGGGIFTWLAPWTGTTIEDVRIADNHAWQGGGIYIADNFTPVTLQRLTLTGNTAGYGGALFVRSTNWTLRDSLLAGNEAEGTGGAIRWTAGEPWTEPCTQLKPCPPANPTGLVDRVVIAGNVADDGAAIHSDFAGLTVSSSIVSGNDGAAQVNATVAPVWRYNDTYPATFAGITDPTGADGNLAVDPGFVGDGDYHLAAGSACIDAGDPAQQDPDGTRSDMGLIGGTP